MSDRVGSRLELERLLRSFLPERRHIGNSLTSSKPSMAVLGFGGVLSGYVWGRIRGRRGRKKR